jgi:site-specific recombinase XerD
MYCKVIVNNGSVVIYYGVGGIMRFPTGAKISKIKDKQKKLKQWDYKNDRVNSDVENSAKMNKAIADWLTKADNIVSQYLIDYGINIPAPELKKILSDIKQGKIQEKSEFFMSNYLEFQERKRIQLVERENKSNESFKTYPTFKNTIEDFQAENDVKLKISDVTNKDWLDLFHSWLVKARPKQITLSNGEIYKFKSIGKLKPGSVDKRFEVLTGFFSYLKEKGLIREDDFLRSYKRTEITVTSKIKTTLSINEIHKLYNHKFEKEAKEKVKLIFLFACLTGFRWKDIEEFNKNFISDFKGRKVYKHIASKTRNSTGKIATIPLSNLAIDILEKLNYKLKLYSNGYTNLVLHDLLKETNFFDELTRSADTDTGKLHKRYESLSMHRGRDTFITNLINIVPLHELMSYTSHEKLSTLQKYIDDSRDINPEYVTIFDKNE